MRLTAILVILAIAMPLGQPAAGQEHMTLRVGKSTAAEGGSADVKVALSEASGLGSMDLLLRFDPRVLRFESQVGVETGEAQIVANSPRRGEVQVALLCGDGLPGADLTFALRFAVLAPGGARSAVEVVRLAAYKAGSTLKMSVRFEGGEVRVAESPAADPATASRPPGGATPSARGPASAPAGWVPDVDLRAIMNVVIATAAGLLVIVLLIGLFPGLRRRAAPPARPPRPISRPPFDDEGPIPLEGSDPSPPTPPVDPPGPGQPPTPGQPIYAEDLTVIP